jgi:hypothetical protein
MKIGSALAAGMAWLSLMGATPQNPPYAEGQVWEYHTRPGDEGSLLRIQKIENLEAFAATGPIYHISIIGLHFAGLPVDGKVQHAPVSKQSLDASVTHLSSAAAVFPDPNEGIATWRAASGGVYTIPIAEIVQSVDQTIRARTGN